MISFVLEGETHINQILMDFYENAYKSETKKMKSILSKDPMYQWISSKNVHEMLQLFGWLSLIVALLSGLVSEKWAFYLKIRW